MNIQPLNDEAKLLQEANATAPHPQTVPPDPTHSSTSSESKINVTSPIDASNQSSDSPTQAHSPFAKILLNALILHTFLIAFIACAWNMLFSKLAGSLDLGLQVSFGMLFIFLGLALLTRTRFARTTTLVVSGVMLGLLLLATPLIAGGFLFAFLFSPHAVMQFFLPLLPLILFPLASLTILNIRPVSRLFN